MTCQTNLVKLRCCNASAITNVEHSVDISTAYKYFSNMLLLFLSILLFLLLLQTMYYNKTVTTKNYFFCDMITLLILQQNFDQCPIEQVVDAVLMLHAVDLQRFTFL